MKILQYKRKRIPLILRKGVEEKEAEVERRKKIPTIYYGITP